MFLLISLWCLIFLTSACPHYKCAIKVTGSSSDPIQTLTEVSESGMVSFNFDIEEDNFEVNLLEISGNDTKLIVKLEEDTLQLKNESGITPLGSCKKRCKINLGWRRTCTEDIDMRYRGEEMDILVKTAVSYSGATLKLISPHDAKITLNNLVVFDYFTSFYDLRSKVFEGQRSSLEPVPQVNWDDLVKHYLHSESDHPVFKVVPGARSFFKYEALTAPTGGVMVQVEQYNAAMSNFGEDGLKMPYIGTFLYLNMVPDLICHVEDPYMLTTSIVPEDARLSVCCEIEVSTTSSHIDIMRFITAKGKSVVIAVEKGMLNLHRDLETDAMVMIPETGKATVCVTVETVSLTEAVITTYVRDLQTGEDNINSVTLNWFWLLERGENEISMGILNIGTAKHAKVANIFVMDSILSVIARNKFMSRAFRTFFREYEVWYSWGEMVTSLVDNPQYSEFFKTSHLQVIRSRTDEDGFCVDVATPITTQCPQSCEYIPYWSACEVHCIDGTTTCSQDDNPYLFGVDLQDRLPRVAVFPRDDVFEGVQNLTICVSMTGKFYGSVINYGDDGEFTFHIQYDESILLVIQFIHIYFPVQLSFSDVNNICLRVDGGLVSAFVNGKELKETSYQKLHGSLTLGKGKLRFLDSSDGKAPVKGQVFGLNVWDKPLTNNEMAIFSSVHNCVQHQSTIISWTDIIETIKPLITKPDNTDDKVKPSSVIFEHLLCGNTAGTEQFLDLNELEVYVPPGITKQDTIMISAEQIGREKSKTFTLGVGDRVCFTLPAAAGVKYNMYFGTENPAGLSNVDLVIGDTSLHTVCYFCKTNILSVGVVSVSSDGQVCIEDTRNSIESIIAGFPANSQTGFTFSRVLFVEDTITWDCPYEVKEQPLFGSLIWYPTNTSSDAICPHGSKNNPLLIAYASRACVNNTWSDDIETSMCQYELEQDNLNHLLKTAAEGRGTLTGPELSKAVVRTVKAQSHMEEDALLDRTLTQTLAMIERDMENARDSCWFMDIFNAMYLSPDPLVFPEFKRTFMKKFLEGGYVDRFPMSCEGVEVVYQHQFDVAQGNLTEIICSTNDPIITCKLIDIESEDKKSDYIRIKFTAPVQSRITLSVIRKPELKNGAYSEILKLDSVTVPTKDVGIRSDVINIHSDSDKETDFANTKVRYSIVKDKLREDQDVDLRKAYCVKEEFLYSKKSKKVHYFWNKTDIELLSRHSDFVDCSVTGVGKPVAVASNINTHDTRPKILKLLMHLVEGLAIFILLVTALICASQVHANLQAANMMTLTCVLYSTYYLIHIFCDSPNTMEKVADCAICGGLSGYLVLVVTFLLLCTAVALHVAIEDSYDVVLFRTKCAVLSLGVPALLMGCLAIADSTTTKSFTSYFLTADKLSDLSPKGCFIRSPFRFAVVVAPQLIVLVLSFVILYRLKMQIDGEKYEGEKLDNATRLLSFVEGALSVVVIFAVNSILSAVCITSQEAVLLYIYLGITLLQAVTFLYFIGLHCTTLLGYLTDSAKRRREALMEGMDESGSLEGSLGSAMSSSYCYSLSSGGYLFDYDTPSSEEAITTTYK